MIGKSGGNPGLGFGLDVTLNVVFTVADVPFVPVMVMVQSKLPAPNPAPGCTVNVLVCPAVNAVVQLPDGVSV